MMRRQPQNQQELRFKDFYELSTLVLNIIRAPPPPPPIVFWTKTRRYTVVGGRGRRFSRLLRRDLLLGISISLMLCGSVTFVIGFVLIPWVLVSVIFLYFVGVILGISMIGRAILCWNSAPYSPSKDASSWKLL